MPLAPLVNGTKNGAKPNWAPILGQWDIQENIQTFRGEGQNAAAYGGLFPMGLAVSNVSMQNGMCRVQIRFSTPFGEGEQAGGIVLGYRSPEQNYIFAELGAARSAYSVGEYVSGFGWRPLVATGQLQNLTNGRDYLGLRRRGQHDRVPNRKAVIGCQIRCVDDYGCRRFDHCIRVGASSARLPAHSPLGFSNKYVEQGRSTAEPAAR